LLWSPAYRSRTIFLVLLALVSIGVFAFQSAKYMSPVPESVSKQVAFTIYYPDQRKLPSGYTLDVSTIRAASKVILYSVNGPKGLIVHFSVQQKLTDSQIQTFYQTNLKMHTDISTSVGTARIGIAQNQSVASLPTTGNAWVVLTSPSTINRAELIQIIRSIRN
jgi:hypothetical protein